MSKKVSVIMPVYNPGKYLKQAIETIMAQTLKDIEIICVDDGCTDGSSDTLLEYKKRDNRIIVLQQKEKSNGAALARNMGIEFATGEYLAFLDADDFFEPEMLEKAYENGSKNDSDIVMFGSWKYNENYGIDEERNPSIHSGYIPKKTCFNAIENSKYIFQMTDGAAWGKIFKKEFVEREKIKFDDLRYVDDAGFTYYALCLADRISVVDERLMHYRVGGLNSQSIQSRQYPEIAYSAAEIIKSKLCSAGIYELYKTSFQNWFLMFARIVVLKCTDHKCLENMYNLFKEKYFNEFGVLEMAENDIYSFHDIEFRDDIIKTNSALEYMMLIKRRGMENWENYCRLVGKSVREKKSSKIAIYGAGVQGKRLYQILTSDLGFKIYGWFDKNYDKLGFPIQSPDEILTLDFDYVIIAIESKNVSNKVKEDLLERGLKESRIICLY